MMKISILPLIASTMLLANSTFYVGQTYDFAEQDMIEAIQEHIENNGDKIQKRYEEMKVKAQDSINNMTPKLNNKLTFATENKVFYANTTYTNPTDIKDANGKIIYKAGYSFEPMDYVTLPYSIVFINGERKKEVAWLKKSNMLNSAAYRILITDGKYTDVSKEIGQHVFFANEQIISRMNIKATPSIASQEKNRLKIVEVCVDCNETK